MSSGLGYVLFFFFFCDVRARTMSRDCGSNFGRILGYDVNP